jgi:hypothetical protein
MFAWKVKQLFQEQARSMSSSNEYSGANRRAINMMPLPLANDGHEIAQTTTIKFHHLLVSIEGNQRTCCLKIISPKRKSRSALLIFRGRVIGSLYGAKSLDKQSFAKEAHSSALTELATPGNILDAYQLPEDLVLASASMFHGQVLDYNYGYTPHQIYQAAADQIKNFGLPGCVVVSTENDEMVCMVYFAQGRTIGVYSSKDGWVDVSSAGSYIANTRGAKVLASVLPVNGLEDVARLTFSLTGLADRRMEPWKRCDSLASRVPNLESHQLRALDHWETEQQRSSQRMPVAAGRIHPGKKVQHVHSVNP